MDIAALLVELYGRIPPLAAGAVDGLSVDQLTESPAPGTNSTAWLIWHLTRVQDHHIAELVDQPQLWVEGEWAAQIRARPGSDQHRLRAQPGAGHGGATREHRRTPRLSRRGRPTTPAGSLERLTPDDLDRVIDRRWDPPVTLGVRLVSVADDCLQHAGQAAYVRGLFA